MNQIRWTKSSFCSASSCVEVRDFRKSTFSGFHECVEVAKSGSCIAVRDSKDPDGPVLHFSPKEWTAFIAGVQAGEFNVSGEGGGN